MPLPPPRTVGRYLFARRAENAPGDGARTPLYLWVLLVAVTVWGGARRLDGLGDWWFNPDEGIYLEVISADADTAATMIRGNAHPPLYFWMLRAMAGVSTDAAWLRLPALLAGIALIPLLFLLGRRVAGSWGGLVSALLVALSPGALMQSYVTRPYALHMAMLAVALLSLCAYVDRRRPWNLVGYAIAMSIALMLHYATLVVLGGVGLFLAAWLFRTHGRGRAVRDLVLANLPVLAAGIWLYFSHIQPYLQGSAMQSEARTGWLMEFYVTSLAQVPEALRRAIVYGFGARASTAVSILVPVGFVFLAFFPGRSKAMRAFAWITLGVALVAVALSRVGQYPLGWSRHALYLTVFFVPLTAAPVAVLLTGSRRVFVLMGLGLVAVLLYKMAPLTHEPVHVLPERAVTRVAAEEVEKQLREGTRPGDLILLDQQTHYVTWSLLTERPSYAPIPGAEPHEWFQLDGRTYVRFGFWYTIGGSGGEPHSLARALAELEKGKDPTMRPASARRRVWLMLGGFGGALNRYLPEAAKSGHRIQGPLFGAPMLYISEFDAQGYRRYVDEE